MLCIYGLKPWKTAEASTKLHGRLNASRTDCFIHYSDRLNRNQRIAVIAIPQRSPLLRESGARTGNARMRHRELLLQLREAIRQITKLKTVNTHSADEAATFVRQG
jgi:hypothetical protein